MTTDALTITITGPQGSGKTRLAEWLGRALKFRGARIAVPGDLPVPAIVDAPIPMNYGGHDYGREDLGSGALAARVAEETSSTASLPDLCREIHASNVVAGWWTDLKTGEFIVPTRNRPEMLMLAVSELAEAAEGIYLQPDDKLPHLCMFDVELADFVIRQLDQIGAEVSLGSLMPSFEGVCSSYLRSRSWEQQLLLLVTIVARAMKHYRKGRVTEYVQTMADGVMHCFAVADANGIDLMDVIAQKRRFNATREDHRVENRRQADGKAF